MTNSYEIRKHNKATEYLNKTIRHIQDRAHENRLVETP